MCLSMLWVSLCKSAGSLEGDTQWHRGIERKKNGVEERERERGREIGEGGERGAETERERD